jgi:hypothetical protein
MPERLPVFKLVIDEDAEGMDFMGLVDYPAHGKNWIAFDKLPKKVEFKQYFNEEKRIVTGVAIATDLQIYRRDPNGFEYNIVFTKEDTLAIMKMFSKRGYFNNVNLMHDMSRKAKGIYLIESFFIKDDRSNIPAEFASQNLRPGSLIFSYYVEDDLTWKFVKENGAGFSIEGWFKEVEIKFNKIKKMENKSIWEKLGIAKPKADTKDKPKFDAKKKYAEAKTADGMTIYWENELKEGEALFIVPAEGGDPVLVAAGEYATEVDGAMWVITVDEAGLVTSVTEAEEMQEEENETEEALVAMKAQFDKQLADQKVAFEKSLTDKMTALASQIEELTEAIEKVAEGSFKSKSKEFSGSKNPGWRKK